MIALDTHVVVWLYAGEIDRIPESVQSRLESDDLGISPIVMLELEYLYEVDRISVGAESICADLSRRIGLVTLDDPFEEIILKSLEQRWTRDPFDRVISAHALLCGYELATKDSSILSNCSCAFWG